jgi:hypothetical protein
MGMMFPGISKWYTTLPTFENKHPRHNTSMHFSFTGLNSFMMTYSAIYYQEILISISPSQGFHMVSTKYYDDLLEDSGFITLTQSPIILNYQPMRQEIKVGVVLIPVWKKAGARM